MKILNWIYETLAKIIKWIMRILLCLSECCIDFVYLFLNGLKIYLKAREDVRKFLNCRKETIKIEENKRISCFCVE